MCQMKIKVNVLCYLDMKFESTYFLYVALISSIQDKEGKTTNFTGLYIFYL